MGDFNDEPWDESISETLGASGDSFNLSNLTGDNLHCLIPRWQKSITGTLKYEGRWYLFDQFMISGSLLAKIISYEIEIVDHNFLLRPDEAYTGQKPFRTYNGYIYQGGYSDHLPVILDLSFKK